jgi:transcriptional regulator with XRE-family HTH domain
MNQEQSKSLGALLRQKRQELGYSMTQLARAADVQDSTVLRFERGEFAAPRPDKLARFATELRMNLADLYAKAGYLVPDELPSLGSYLTAKFPDLSDEAKTELCQHLDKLSLGQECNPVPSIPLQELSDDAAGGTT